jgi:penicillin-binding protein 1A
MAFSRFRKFREKHPRLTRGTALAFAFLFAAGMGFAYSAWALVCNGGRCPSATALDDYQPRQTSKLYAIDGRFIAEIGLEKRTLVTLDKIPPLVRDAFLVTEDKRFYDHAGIDWIRVGGSVVANVTSGTWAEGFSTISMQLARNVFPERISREKTPLRKLKEAKVARAIEARYPKDNILELYLNQIDLGSGAHGVETAAQRYFGKSVGELNIAEAATLAALPKAPGRYNPRRFPDRAVQRRNTVIELMRRRGVVSDADASLAKAYPLQLAEPTESGDVGPYFVEWVRQALDRQFGKQLYEQGLKVYTTLDIDMQTAAERALERQLRAIEAGRHGPYRQTTYEQYLARASQGDDRAANSPYLQGAFIALDPRTGAVRALVGGRDFDDSKFNRATQALRQPGSTFKPIVYAAAVQNARAPAYILEDAPLSVQQAVGPAWTPQNYDRSFEGAMPMRRALYQSRNIPAVRMGMELGEGTVIEEAKRFGLTTTIPAYPSIHLGAAEVYPIELVAAYSTFATLGNRPAAPFAILRVENTRGEVLWAPEPSAVPVMRPDEAWLMVSMLKDVVQRGTAAGSVGSQLQIPSGGKTGTTNDGTDVWYVGFTSDLVAGVWMGFDRPKRIKANAQGGQLAAPAWTAFMREVYRRKPVPPDWPRPASIVMRRVDRTTGLLATDYCPASVVVEDYFVAGTDPALDCTAHGYMLYPDTTFAPYSAEPYPSLGNPQPTRPLPPARDTSFRNPSDTAARRPATRPQQPGRAQRDTSPTIFRPVPRDTVRPQTRPDTGDPFRIPP